MKRFKVTPFRPWETKTKDGLEKRYFRMGVSQMSTEAMRQLSPTAFKIYCYMKLESGGNNEFTFPHTKYSSYLSRPTFIKAVRELESSGFVDVVQRNKNLRTANVYKFSERWKLN